MKVSEGKHGEAHTEPSAIASKHCAKIAMRLDIIHNEV